jgi:predicted nucleic acid-binding protein
VSNKWVVNASPLILLAKVEHISLLPKLTEQLVIPTSVVAEVQGGPSSDPAQAWLSGEGAAWFRADIAAVSSVAAWDLGAGETAVLSWAHEHGDFEAILDDRAARKCAVIERIPVRGTLGVATGFSARLRANPTETAMRFYWTQAILRAAHCAWRVRRGPENFSPLTSASSRDKWASCSPPNSPPFAMRLCG